MEEVGGEFMNCTSEEIFQLDCNKKKHLKIL